ncbi:MAG: hypothetical protein NTU73_08855 [Ignavibacteriae bacterium]|nr:hypothetical protein [Ignavibacteriota bacterium]
MKNKHLIMKSVNLILIFTLFLVTLVISISSCNKDNPVNISNGSVIVDSNVFNWKIDTLYMNPTGDCYIADTNNIIIPGVPNSVFINNGVVTYINHNYNEFVCYCVNGTDINNVYLGGINGVTSKPKLKKWNPGGIVDIPVPDSISACIQNIVCNSENDIWMSTTKNIIFHYFNQSFEIYRLESGYEAGVVFKNASNSIYSEYIKFITNDSYYVTVFKFENNSWVQVCKDSIDSNTEMGDYIGFSEDKILRRGKTGIYYFTGNNWEKYANFGSRIDYIYCAGGNAPQNIMFSGYFNHVQGGLFFFNGDKLFKTPYNKLPYNVSYRNINYKFDKYYITTSDASFENYLLTAKLKK